MRTLNHEQIKEVLIGLSIQDKKLKDSRAMIDCWNGITEKTESKIYSMDDGLKALCTIENYRQYLKNSPRFNMTKRFMSIDRRNKKLCSAASLFEFDSFSLDKMAEHFKGMTIQQILDEFNDLAKLEPISRKTVSDVSRNLSFNAFRLSDEEMNRISTNISRFIWKDKGLPAHDLLWLFHFYGRKTGFIHAVRIEHLPSVKDMYGIDLNDLNLFKKGDWAGIFKGYYDDCYADILDEKEMIKHIRYAFRNISAYSLLQAMTKAEDRIRKQQKRQNHN